MDNQTDHITAQSPAAHPSGGAHRLARLWLWRLFAGLALANSLLSVWTYRRLKERNRLVDEFVARATVGVDRDDSDAVTLALSNAIYTQTNQVIESKELSLYERLVASSFFNLGPAASLKHGTFGLIGSDQLGACGTMSRVLLVSLWHAGIPARKLQLYEHPTEAGSGHTMVEFKAGERWQVISPSDSSFTWRNEEGQIATVDEIRNDRRIFGQVLKIYPSYPYRFDYPWHIRWEKLPRGLRSIMQFLLGPERYRNAVTPRIYEQPRLLLFLGSIAGLVFFITMAWLARRHAFGR